MTNGAKTAALARQAGDLVRDEFRKRDDDARRRDRRYEDDNAECPPEQSEERQGEAEPEALASDDRRGNRHMEDEDKRDDAVIRSMKRELEDLKRVLRRPRPFSDDELNALAEKQQE
jgi:hypothetical protein